MCESRLTSCRCGRGRWVWSLRWVRYVDRRCCRNCRIQKWVDQRRRWRWWSHRCCPAGRRTQATHQQPTQDDPNINLWTALYCDTLLHSPALYCDTSLHSTAFIYCALLHFCPVLYCISLLRSSAVLSCAQLHLFTVLYRIYLLLSHVYLSCALLQYFSSLNYCVCSLCPNTVFLSLLSLLSFDFFYDGRKWKKPLSPLQPSLWSFTTFTDFQLQTTFKLLCPAFVPGETLRKLCGPDSDVSALILVNYQDQVQTQINGSEPKGELVLVFLNTVNWISFGFEMRRLKMSPWTLEV